MIAPRSDMQPQSERPPFEIQRWKRALTPLVRLICKRLRHQYDDRVRESGLLLESANKCIDRQQLEELLGRPRYTMLGDHYGTSDSVDGPISRPDIVEVYERDGCMIEVWFKDGELMTMHGLAFPTAWEFLSGAAIASEPIRL